MSEKVYNFPVFGTQGGGLVREVKNGSKFKYIFVEKSDCPGLGVGDTMPDEWGIVPANRAASQMIEEDQMSPDEIAEMHKLEAMSPEQLDDHIARLETQLGLESLKR